MNIVGWVSVIHPGEDAEKLHLLVRERRRTNKHRQGLT